MMTININNMLEQVRTYSRKELKEVASRYDQTEEFPAEHIQYLIGLGILELMVVAEAERTASYKEFLRIIRIVSKQFPAVGSILLTQATYGIWPLYNFGTTEQKATYLDKLIKGDMYASFAINEESVGSDLEELETVAIEKADHWEITGQKAYISNSPIASLFFIVAKTRSLDGQESHGVFLVDKTAEGLTVGPLENKMGIKSLPVAGLTIKSVKVPKENLLGGIIQGVKQVESVVNRNRLAISAQAIGISQGALERGLEYVSFERNFGKRLIDLQATQYKLADVQTRILSTRAFLLQTVDEAPFDTQQVSMLKLASSNVAIETTETIIDVTGGYGYMRNNEIERFVRDAKLTSIYGSSSNTQRKIIAQPWLSKI